MVVAARNVCVCVCVCVRVCVCFQWYIYVNVFNLYLTFYKFPPYLNVADSKMCFLSGSKAV